MPYRPVTTGPCCNVTSIMVYCLVHVCVRWPVNRTTECFTPKGHRVETHVFVCDIVHVRLRGVMHLLHIQEMTPL